MPLEKSKDDVKKNKDIAAASYLWIMSVVILFTRRYSHFIQFHARQATALFVISVVLWIFPYIRYLNILVLAAMIIGFIEATQGRYYKIPLIADLVSQKITFKNVWQMTKKGLEYVWDLLKRIFQPEGDSKTDQKVRQEKISKSDDVGDLQKELKNIHQNMEKESKLMHQLEEKINKIK